MHGGDLAYKVRQVNMAEQLPTQASHPELGRCRVCYPKEGLGVFDCVFYPGDEAPAANYTSENKRFMISVSQRM